MIPRIDDHLPDLLPFIREIAGEYERGGIKSRDVWSERIQTGWTPERIDATDHVVPGWRAMIEHPYGMNLVHINSALVALMLQPEYRALSADQKTLIEWIVLFHDVAKRRIPTQRDHVHTFRSTALAGAGIAALGFPMLGDNDALAAWSRLTHDAITTNAGGEPIPDNRLLPQITDGIRTLFGWDTPAGLILRGVLHHQAITNVQVDPQAAPLSPNDVLLYVNPPLFPLLRSMMLADCDAWTLFDPDYKAIWREETLGVFANVARLIDL